MSDTTQAATGGLGLWLEAIRRDRKASAGAVILALFALIALVGPLLVGDLSRTEQVLQGLGLAVRVA